LSNHVFALFSDLNDMLNQKKQVDDGPDINVEKKQQLCDAIKSQSGASLAEYGIMFYHPLQETVELLKEGQTTEVTLDNLEGYI